MKKVDYIVVGNGLAGIAFCQELRAHRKSFIVFDNGSEHSSKVAAGLYNPVILKHFTKVWNAKSQLELALPKYKELENILGVKLDYKMPVYRRFTSAEEQNKWFAASDSSILSQFLSTNLIKNTNSAIDAKFGFGEVFNSGRINTSALVSEYALFLKKENQLRTNQFQHDLLKLNSEHIQYEDIQSKYIVFAEGFGLSQNPLFKNLPLVGTKGEMLTIKAPGLKINFIIKSSVFIVPLGEDLFWIGATYERLDKTYSITETAKTSLLDKLKQIITCDFEVVQQAAGIRPTTKDRRPIVGAHSKYKNVFVLNGLGTRGVMISPYVAQQLFNYIEKGVGLNPEIDINRFTEH